MRTSVALMAMAFVSACVHPPRQLEGEFAQSTVYDAQAADRTGERVRWGGTIVSTTPEKNRTCLEIVSKPLDRRAHPRDVDQSYGRFDACGEGFYDPEIYAPERDVTVVGTIEGSRSGRVGEYDYLFPRVAAEVVLLWPEPPLYDRGAYYYPSGVYIGPAWYPYAYPYWWGYYGGWGGWGGWGGGWHGGHGHGGGGHGGGWGGGGGGGGPGGGGGGPGGGGGGGGGGGHGGR